MRLKLYILLVFSFILQNCIAQSSTNIDTIASTQYESQEEVLKEKSEWLTKALVSQDSIIKFIATKADQELHKQPEIRYTFLIVQTLLSLQKDTGFAIILKNISIYPFINNSKFIDVAQKIKSYPVMMAIERTPPDQIIGFKDYIVKSNYLDNELLADEIYLMHRLLFDLDPTYGMRIKEMKFEGQKKRNIDAIIAWKYE